MLHDLPKIFAKRKEVTDKESIRMTPAAGPADIARTHAVYADDPLGDKRIGHPRLGGNLLASTQV
jgi:hypothetical protein